MSRILFFLIVSVQCHLGATIIFLNGTSSAGKSSLSRAFLEKVDDLYLHTGLDHFLWNLSPFFFDHDHEEKCGYHLVYGVGGDPQSIGLVKDQIAKDFTKAIHRAMLALAESGVNMIIEEALFDVEDYLDYLEVFKDQPFFFIGVDASLEVLEKREALRTDRMVGIARGLREAVHEGKNYDLMVDTTSITPSEAADQIIAFIHKHF